MATSKGVERIGPGEPMSNKEFQFLCVKLIRSRIEIKDYTDTAKKVQTALIGEFVRRGVTKAHGLTHVTPTESVINPAKLRKKIGAAKFKLCTKEVLDRSLLDAQIAVGNIRAEDVAACMEDLDRTEYLTRG